MENVDRLAVLRPCPISSQSLSTWPWIWLCGSIRGLDCRPPSGRLPSPGYRRSRETSMIVLWQILCRIKQWTNVENRLVFRWVIDTSRVSFRLSVYIKVLRLWCNLDLTFETSTPCRCSINWTSSRWQQRWWCFCDWHVAWRCVWRSHTNDDRRWAVQTGSSPQSDEHCWSD